MVEETIVFAGGCFWCSQAEFRGVPGVIEVISGYTGGNLPFPTYSQVSQGTTGHKEAVLVSYNSSIISCSKLLDVFWKHIDPTDKNGQFADRGSQYSTSIYYTTLEQKKLAKESKNKIQKYFDKLVVTQIVELGKFYEAEEYHQDYDEKNPVAYRQYKIGSGREDFIEEKWSPKLSEIAQYVTQEGGTEEPFNNEYWNNKEEGIYVDIISGEPLFSSKDKFDSGTGWPSFVKPISKGSVIETEDNSWFSKRTEIRATVSDAHLGHVFPDGPEPTGLRYCMNSAALKFIPKEELKEKGYEEYLKEFN